MVYSKATSHILNRLMDEIYTLPYDMGINADIYAIWRNDGDIGYVQMAFKVLVEAMYDLVLGDSKDHESASWFFFGGESESYYQMWARSIGIPDGELPTLVKKFRAGQVSQQDLEDIRNLCTTMKTI